MTHEPVSPSLGMARSCPACGSEVAQSLLSCPACHWLVHGDRLKELAGSADAAEAEGDLASALVAWRDAAVLLPQDSRQYTIVAGRIARLGRQVEAAPARPRTAPGATAAAPQATRKSPWSGGVASGVVGTLALAAWKLKFLVVLLLTKGKIVLLGLTKASTFLSMFATVGVYWTIFGPWLALGLVLSIYIHEMGHVVVLMRYGVRATAPLFIPGVGALIRLNQPLIDPKQDARAGLGGPIWGLGAALFCGAVYALTGRPIWAALTQLGALINLFNLMPFWQLDGARAFRSLNRSQRWLAVASIAAAWAITDQWLLVLLLAVAAFHTVADKPNDEPDAPILAQYALLVMVLSALSQIDVPLGGWKA
jgi:Zn-dependent protease